MANYLVSVRNYHWSHQNTLVRCPTLDLTVPVSTLIVQPLEGVNKQEPRVLDSTTDLKDDIQSDVYEAEAHGVLVSTDPSVDESPIWVPIHSYNCRENEAYVVNLTTFKASNVPIAHICWVPGYQAHDGKLYTIIGAPRKHLRETRVLVLAQQVGFPREAKFIALDPVLLASYDTISQSQKKALFDIQLRYIRTGSNPPSTILANGYRVFSSPDRLGGQGRLSLEEILVEDLKVPRRTHSVGSFQSSSDYSSDEDPLYDPPTYVSLVASPERPYTCGCTYAGLFPTCFDPCPSHRHGTDEECSLGSSHTEHCVFADRKPDECVISTSSGKHTHCVHPLQATESDLEGNSEEDYFADVEALYDDTGREIGDELPMDIEPAFVDSPPLTYLSEMKLDMDWVTINPGEFNDVELLCLPGSAALTETFEEPARGPYVNLEHYSSPEPQDMVV